MLSRISRTKMCVWCICVHAWVCVHVRDTERVREREGEMRERVCVCLLFWMPDTAFYSSVSSLLLHLSLYKKKRLLLNLNDSKRCLGVKKRKKKPFTVYVPTSSDVFALGIMSPIIACHVCITPRLS